MKTNSSTLQLQARALSSGVELIGITPAKVFTKRGKTDTAVNPKEPLDDARSIVVVAFHSHDRPGNLGLTGTTQGADSRTRRA